GLFMDVVRKHSLTASSRMCLTVVISDGATSPVEPVKLDIEWNLPFSIVATFFQ
ncbi:hypothetical protein HAX54_029811, partial [Datura stramonium]|nr:hypothetical protein [Datura stramonium]